MKPDSAKTVCNSVSKKNISKANPVNIGAKEIGSNPFAPTLKSQSFYFGIFFMLKFSLLIVLLFLNLSAK